MEDDVLRPAQCFERTDDQFLATLAENLDRDVVGNAFFVNQSTTKIEFNLGGGWKPHLDFLKPDFHQEGKILELLLDVHRLRESLVAVAEINAAPLRSPIDRAAGPLAVRQIYL